MNLHFTARKTDLTPEVRQYCEKRLLTLERLLGTVLEVDVILSVAKTRNRAEIHVMSKGTGLVVEEETHEMLNSLNRAFDSLENKIKKEREKFRERKRRKGRERKDLALPIESEEPVQRIVRSSSYSLKPMSLEEAVLQMDVKSREIFVFRKEGSEKWAVLFRRKDGNIGLVEPE
jgi:putative sigma-54 modulation protein